MTTSNELRFHKNDNIGAPCAEEDGDYLSDCFVDTGDIELLLNPTDRHVIILGRTGTGKTALLKELEKSSGDRVINIKPENLALTYIANSSVISFFTEIGINLDPFFKLLWRHIFTIEILTRFFGDTSNEGPPSLFDRLRSLFSGQSRQDKEIKQAIDYLEQWGSKFWNETEFRVKEITQKFEDELKNSLNAALGNNMIGINGSHANLQKITEEQKTEVINRGQEIVSKTQVHDLHRVFDLLDQVLNNKQKTYYIVLDGLDENWVEEKLRYKLIMGLILTAREFIKVSNVKVLIALRRDLIDRVFRLTRESGFQQEKYEGLTLPLVWTKSNIIEILNRRVTRLIKHKYTKQQVTYKDILPDKYQNNNIDDYIYSIAQTPRDIITFFNCCILAAIDKIKLTSTILTQAISEYSRLRYRALGDEWYSDYPHLLDFASIFQGKPSSFKMSTISQKEIEDICLNVVANNPSGKGGLFDAARFVIEGLTDYIDFRKTLILISYRIGLVGLKVTSNTSTLWSSNSTQIITRGQIDDNTSISISPKYAIALGVHI